MENILVWGNFLGSFHWYNASSLFLLVFLEFLLFLCEPPELVFWFSYLLFPIFNLYLLVVTFLLLFVVQPSPTLCNPMDYSRPGLPVLHHLPEVAQTHVHPAGDAIQPSHPLPSPSPPAFDLSQHQSLNELALRIRWWKYWSFSFSISPSIEYSGLISFRIDWFDLAVQETLKSLLQHNSSEASILQHSVFFMVQLSHPYITPGKSVVFRCFVSLNCLLIINNNGPKSWLETPNVYMLYI